MLHNSTLEILKVFTFPSIMVSKMFLPTEKEKQLRQQKPLAVFNLPTIG